MSTAFSNATSYLSTAEFLKRCDVRTVAQLCSDDGTEIDHTALLTNANLLAALLDASGAVESACLRGARYSPTDLAGLTGAAQGYLFRLIGRLTTCYIWERRPDLSSEPPAYYKATLDALSNLEKGVAIFGIQEVADAGILTTERILPPIVEQRNEVSLQAQRLFGRRAAWFEQ